MIWVNITLPIGTPSGCPHSGGTPNPHTYRIGQFKVQYPCHQGCNGGSVSPSHELKYFLSFKGRPETHPVRRELARGVTEKDVAIVGPRHGSDFTEMMMYSLRVAGKGRG